MNYKKKSTNLVKPIYAAVAIKNKGVYKQVKNITYQEAKELVKQWGEELKYEPKEWYSYIKVIL